MAAVGAIIEAIALLAVGNAGAILWSEGHRVLETLARKEIRCQESVR